MVKVRSIFLSDIHLGTRGCQADRLLDFLREFESDHLFLIGDIIDFWSMGRSIQWSAMQNTVVQKILRRARHGEKVVFIPGNHDEAMREYSGTLFGDILIAFEWLHVTADGKRLLLTHGDQFDQVTRHHRWLADPGRCRLRPAGARQRLAVLVAPHPAHQRLLVSGRIRQAQGQVRSHASSSISKIP